jgi:hypothetical protein
VGAGGGGSFGRAAAGAGAPESPAFFASASAAASAGGAVDAQRGVNRRDPTATFPTGIVIEKAAVFDGSMAAVEIPASPEAIG